MSGIGHNSSQGDDTFVVSDAQLKGGSSDAPVSDDQLRLFVERIERLEEEKKGVADDIRDVYLESKSQGYDPKIMRQIIRLRKMPVQDRREMAAVLGVYKNALGMDDDHE